MLSLLPMPSAVVEAVSSPSLLWLTSSDDFFSSALLQMLLHLRIPAAGAWAVAAAGVVFCGAGSGGGGGARSTPSSPSSCSSSCRPELAEEAASCLPSSPQSPQSAPPADSPVLLPAAECESSLPLPLQTGDSGAALNNPVESTPSTVAAGCRPTACRCCRSSAWPASIDSSAPRPRTAWVAGKFRPRP